MEKRKLILRNFLSPGDLVMLTAAVRDLHHHYPGRFLTDVRTSCPELWEHNPHLTPLRETDRRVEQIDCHYPLIDRSNETACHFIHGFADFLSSRLRLSVRPTLFRGDIHLSSEERQWKSTVHDLAGCDLPFWIVNAGGKFDFTIKWWDWRRYQQVIDHFRGRVLFVQVGEIGHYHPPLKNVLDLRGRTDLRQLVRLVYHSQGVLCGVTALMHLAAAVPTRPDRWAARPAVIVAGGREPPHWEAYPHHQFIHTIGALSCCAKGGCWRSRTRALGDGEENDHPNNLCSDVVGDLPRCMDMITAEDMIRRVESYFAGGANRYLTSQERPAAERAIAKTLKGPRFETTINLGTVAGALEQAAREARRSSIPNLEGRGVVLFAANTSEMTEVLACVRVLRARGSDLPIECHFAGPSPRRLRTELCLFGATILRVPFDDARSPGLLIRAELRLRALTQSRLREALVLEPGTFPLVAPEKLFAARAFRRSGILFPRRSKFRARRGVWNLCGLSVPRSSADAAAFLIDRKRCSSVLPLWRWIVDRAYFFTGYVDGDGGGAQLAFAKLSLPAPLSTLLKEHFWPSSPNTPAPEVIRRELRAARRLLS
jgi:ADP-heptose:LPS heptosyltransferase